MEKQSFLVLFAILVLLFLPSFLSSSPFRGFWSTAVKGGWDTLNLVLVLFAILCGLLGLRNAEDEGDKSPPAAPSSNDWYGIYGAQIGFADHPASGIRTMSSSSSYPDLRQEAAWGGATFYEERRFYDDIQLSRRRSESRSLEMQSVGDAEAKVIPVDTFVIRRSQSPMARPLTVEPPQSSTERLPRRRSMENVFEIVEDKDVILEQRKLQQAAAPRPQLRRGMSLEKIPEKKVGRDENSRSRHRRRSSLEDLANWETEGDWGVGVEKPHSPQRAPPPPTPPPPPPLPSQGKMSHKRSGGGAKDIAAAIALFYQKTKKGGKTKKGYGDVSLRFVSSAIPPPPPPPPPPPSSVFHTLFSVKKTKSRRIHSLSASPPPPPPPPLPLSTTRRSKKQAPSPPPPPSRPPPFSTTRRFKKESSPPPSPSPPPRPPTRRSNKQSPLPPPAAQQANPHKSRQPYVGSFPLPPSPLRPPPQPPPLSDDEEATTSPETKTDAVVPAFWPSPDVNNKAEIFIARFHAGLKLEKQNSTREKQQQQQQPQRQQEELMLIGSLFYDDLISS